MDKEIKEIEELLNLLIKIYNTVNYQSTNLSADKVFNKELKDIIDILTSNINITPKYIIFLPIEIIELRNKKKYYTNYDSEMKNMNKPNPIKIINLKKAGFLGIHVIKIIEDITISLSLVYTFVCEFFHEYKMNINLKNDIAEYYLFYRDLNQKFIELNKIICLIIS